MLNCIEKSDGPVTLFFLKAEIVAISLHNLVITEGIVVNNKCIKLYQQADHFTLFLKDIPQY